MEKLIGAGRAADVYAIGDGLVIRRYRADHDSAAEGALMQHLGSCGYPVPRVERAEGREIVMERIDGPTTLSDLGKHPWRMRRHARTLADLHQRLARIPAPPTLTRSLGAVSEVDGVLHLDLHPENVMLSARGPLVIDWSNARRGDGRLEAANTWLIMATSELPSTGVDRLIATVGRRAFIATFLRRFDRSVLRQAFPMVADLRLADANTTATEASRVRGLLADIPS